MEKWNQRGGTGNYWIVNGSRSQAEIVESSLARPDEFGEIFSLHWVAVFRFCDRRVGEGHAEELASEVFRIAFENRHRYDPTISGSCLPWLYGIASNLVLKDRRRFARHLNAIERFASMNPPGLEYPEHDAVTRVDALPTWMVVKEALVGLDPTSVQMLLLVAWEDMTYAEVAEAFSVPIGTVRSRIHRVRSQLKSTLGSASTTQTGHVSREDSQ